MRTLKKIFDYELTEDGEMAIGSYYASKDGDAKYKIDISDIEKRILDMYIDEFLVDLTVDEHDYKKYLDAINKLERKGYLSKIPDDDYFINQISDFGNPEMAKATKIYRDIADGSQVSDEDINFAIRVIYSNLGLNADANMQGAYKHFVYGSNREYDLLDEDRSAKDKDGNYILDKMVIEAEYNLEHPEELKISRSDKIIMLDNLVQYVHSGAGQMPHPPRWTKPFFRVLTELKEK